MKLARKLPPPLGRWDSDPEVIRRGASAQPAAARLAKGLGWFSIALGVAELLAPRPLARALGMPRHSGLLRGYGAREIATGIAVLSVDPRLGLWARVGGDALDLGTLAWAARANGALGRGGNKLRGRLLQGGAIQRNLSIAAIAVAGVMVLDAACATVLQRRHARRAQRGALRDYSDRSGFEGTPASMRGAARDFSTPRQYNAQLPLPESGGGEQRIEH